ncbi:DoxX family protein [Actinomadura sp. 7K534]|uniref:DoxX family protein n=1 Tax=Actinomadura sp. 7K534 TaxID=2530366 RepID=UPI001052C2F3|nr:DoxX family protein [Actinomadura sp. 7K534]TDB95994.1 DoxX family protein [Actinomadura sp. 7K534]
MAALETGLLVATVGCVLANSFEVVAKAVRADFVIQNCTEVGVARKWIPHLAVLEGAGVAGLVLGLLGLPLLGLAAAAGLVLFFAGAVVVHVRARVLHNIAFPLLFLGLAVAAAAHFAQ